MCINYSLSMRAPVHVFKMYHFTIEVQVTSLQNILQAANQTENKKLCLHSRFTWKVFTTFSTFITP